MVSFFLSISAVEFWGRKVIMAEQLLANNSKSEDSAFLEELTSNENSGVDSVLASRKPRRNWNAFFPVVTAIAAFALLLGAGWNYTSAAYAVNVSRADYLSERADYEALTRDLQETHESAVQLLTNCSAAVGDESLCEALTKSVTEVEKLDTSKLEKIDPYKASNEDISSFVKMLKQRNKKICHSISDLQEKMDAIHGATSTKTREDYDKAVKQLNDLISQAREFVEEFRDTGFTDEDNLEEAVTDAADNAEKYIAGLKTEDEETIRDYTALTRKVTKVYSDLNNALKKLQDFHDEQQRRIDEARARSINAPSASPSNNTQNQPNNQPSAVPGTEVNQNQNQNQNVPPSDNGDSDNSDVVDPIPPENEYD